MIIRAGRSPRSGPAFASISLAIGENHKKANDMLADKASQTITVVGEVSEKGGTKMVAIHEIVKR